MRGPHREQLWLAGRVCHLLAGLALAPGPSPLALPYTRVVARRLWGRAAARTGTGDVAD